jgi:oligopeptide transport system permease protein
MRPFVTKFYPLRAGLPRLCFIQPESPLSPTGKWRYNAEYETARGVKRLLEDILKRFLNGLVTLFVVISATFFLIRVLPGGPFDQDRKLPPAIQANMEAKFHLNEPVFNQYVHYITHIAHGDLGPSYKYVTRSVNDIVAEASWVSFQIGGAALFLGVGLGILMGTFAGITRNRWLDGFLSAFGISSISMPSFIFGAFLVLVFAYYLNLLPAARLASPQHFILPIITLSLTPFAYTFLLIRTTVKEVRRQQFVMIKHCFGIPNLRVTFLHVLRNSLIPLISILGPISAMIITGSFAVELIFAVPGLGKYFVTGVTNRDYTLVMGITILYSVLLIVFNTFTDILYALVDPRLRDAGRQTV